MSWDKRFHVLAAAYWYGVSVEKFVEFVSRLEVFQTGIQRRLKTKQLQHTTYYQTQNSNDDSRTTQQNKERSMVQPSLQ